VKVAAFFGFFLIPLWTHAVELRVATYNVGAHLVIPPEGGPAYFDYGIGDPGFPDHDRVAAVLQRLDADVVALQEIHAADLSGTPDDVDALAATLGYPHVFVAPSTNTFDTSLRVMFLSRHPFLSTTSIGSPAGAKEITRLHPAVRVDVPGTTRDPLLISAHLKSGTDLSDRFRRTVEMRRLSAYLTSSGLTADDNFIVMGDFNLSSTNRTFDTLPSGLPGSFDLGADISLPISYSTNPLSYFNNPSVVRLDPRQLNNSTSTFQSGSTIDLILVSPAIAGRPLATEVYNSTLDVSNSAGLPKAGAPLAAGTSAEASDHLAVFADLELDAEFPNLALALSSAMVAEGLADGTVTVTVTLPAARATALTVTLNSDDAGIMPISPSLSIPAGALSGVFGLKIPRNFVENPPRSVTLTAAATGYDPASQVLNVTDADGPYEFLTAGQTIGENFTGFSGPQSPAPWVSTGGVWRGSDSGTSVNAGFRAYGSAADPSLGFLPGGSAGSSMATFVNSTPIPLTALEISYTAEQWRAAQGGTADILTADLWVNGEWRSLPGLTYSPATGLPTGAIVGGTSTARSLRVTGLNIAPGASFDLRFTFTPGPGSGTLPADVFLNEFHYDNAGGDVGEFVEVVVGPGFSGSLSDIDVLLYDGNSRAPYRTLNLQTAFTLGDNIPVAGSDQSFKIYSVDTSGIENGPDGIAVVNKTTQQVYQFISYEGSFASSVAVSGIAVGTNSTNIGVSQTTTETIGQSALGLTGTGSIYSQFTWQKIAGAYTKGGQNSGQTLSVPGLPSQGFAIDNLAVTFLADTDGDGILDVDDADDDNDGSPDVDEIVFGSNPLDAGSRFVMTLVYPAPSPGLVRISFPTASGRTYQVESSVDLTAWEGIGTYEGTGSPRTVDFPVDALEKKRFYRMKATQP
jgi:endonuclease/exonuclease/phosphatase family metal-dependent hydrolase